MRIPLRRNFARLPGAIAAAMALLMVASAKDSFGRLRRGGEGSGAEAATVATTGAKEKSVQQLAC
jgi:hypothetical protein